MTPPDANLEKQKRRHLPALIAIAAVLVFALVTLGIRYFYATDPDETQFDAVPVQTEDAEGG